MNNIYNFEQIYQLKDKQKKTILQYVLLFLLFVFCLVMLLIFVKNNALVCIVIGVLSVVFVLFSIAFWKIKYGYVKNYIAFFDDMEMGKTEDYVGEFQGIMENNDSMFDVYVFVSNGKKTELLVLNLYKMGFVLNQKYHLVCVGEKIVKWEALTSPSDKD